MVNIDTLVRRGGDGGDDGGEGGGKEGSRAKQYKIFHFIRRSVLLPWSTPPDPRCAST